MGLAVGNVTPTLRGLDPDIVKVGNPGGGARWNGRLYDRAWTTEVGHIGGRRICVPVGGRGLWEERISV